MPTERGSRGSSSAAALVSGGVDSAVLCDVLSSSYERVYPIYVRFGLRWEAQELLGLRAFLKEARIRGLEPLVVLDQPVDDLYGSHWSLGGEVPDADSPDEAVYLPGRNLLLIMKAAIWCGLRGIETIALGSLEANPFADSTPAFDRALGAVINRALAHECKIIRPFASYRKSDVLKLGRDLPLDLTVSCLDPSEGIHCGACNKCAERRKAFLEIGLNDRTAYLADSVAAAPGKEDHVSSEPGHFLLLRPPPHGLCREVPPPTRS